MLIINLNGGLGNQMFQFAAASMLAEKNKCSIKMDVTSFESEAIGATPRVYELSIFKNIDNKFAKQKEIKKYLNKTSVI